MIESALLELLSKSPKGLTTRQLIDLSREEELTVRAAMLRLKNWSFAKLDYKDPEGWENNKFSLNTDVIKLYDLLAQDPTKCVYRAITSTGRILGRALLPLEGNAREYFRSRLIPSALQDWTEDGEIVIQFPGEHTEP